MGTLSLTDPVNGTTADATLIATNNAAIKTVVNGGLDDSNIAASAGIAASKLSGYPADGTVALLGDGTWGSVGAAASNVPSGALLSYAAASAPSGWLLCDGSAVSRTTYSGLFAVISTVYGAGDGTTTFNLPDMRGRSPVGFAASGGHADVSTLGGNDGSALASRRPKHKHTVSPSTVVPSVVADTAAGTGNYPSSSVPLTVGPQTGAEPTDTPAYLVVNYIIKT